MSISRWLTQAGADAWEAALTQSFVEDVTADALPPAVFRRYLVLEYQFVDTAARVLGRAVHVAPGLPSRRRLASALAQLTTDQYDYFHEVARDMGVRLPASGEAVPRDAAALHDHFLEVAHRGNYGELLACMLGAEWLYATWCERVEPVRLADPRLRNWVALHTDASFTRHVEWLRQELDAVGADADEDCRQQYLTAFTGTLHTEIPFHDAAYGSPPGGR